MSPCVLYFSPIHGWWSVAVRRPLYVIGCHSVTQPAEEVSTLLPQPAVVWTAAAKTDGPHSNEGENLRFRWITWFGLNTALKWEKININCKKRHLNHLYSVMSMFYRYLWALSEMTKYKRVKQIMERERERVSWRAVLCRLRLLSVGSGSDQGGLVVLCLWDWLPVIVNLSPRTVMDDFACVCLCVCVCKREEERGPEIRVCQFFEKQIKL